MAATVPMRKVRMAVGVKRSASRANAGADEDDRAADEHAAAAPRTRSFLRQRARTSRMTPATSPVAVIRRSWSIDPPRAALVPRPAIRLRRAPDMRLATTDSPIKSSIPASSRYHHSRCDCSVTSSRGGSTAAAGRRLRASPVPATAVAISAGSTLARSDSVEVDVGRDDGLGSPSALARPGAPRRSRARSLRRRRRGPGRAASAVPTGSTATRGRRRVGRRVGRRHLTHRERRRPFLERRPACAPPGARTAGTPASAPGRSTPGRGSRSTPGCGRGRPCARPAPAGRRRSGPAPARRSAGVRRR